MKRRSFMGFISTNNNKLSGIKIIFDNHWIAKNITSLRQVKLLRPKTRDDVTIGRLGTFARGGCHNSLQTRYFGEIFSELVITCITTQHSKWVQILSQ